VRSSWPAVCIDASSLSQTPRVKPWSQSDQN
jgi:hypothetical protein